MPKSLRIIQKHQISKPLHIVFFLLPTLVFVFAFIAFPIIYSAFLSLTEYNYGYDSQPRFIGLRGYMNLFTSDRFFKKALLNQLRYAAFYCPITFFAALVIAILLNEIPFLSHLFQVIFYLPMIIPLSIVGVIFGWLLAEDLGIVNLLLRSNINWYGNPNTALYCLAVADSWKVTSFIILVFLAGLQGFPKELREAARVDGCNFLQEVCYVVLPNLKPYLAVGGIWVIINSMKTFDLPAVLTKGGPGTSTLTLYYYAWRLAFIRLDIGQAARVAYIVAFLILGISWALNRVMRSDFAR